MSEHDFEQSPGLPGKLPPGERIVWQGAPDWRTLARSAYHTRWIAFYFVALALLGAAAGSLGGALITLAAGGLCLVVVAALAWAQARSTIYTLTNRRIVMRVGVAVPTCINLPLKQVGTADLRPLGGGHGDIALTTIDAKLAWWMLWPHARPWRISRPDPMLRALPDAEQVAKLLARAAAEAAPIERRGFAPVTDRPFAAPAAGAHA